MSIAAARVSATDRFKEVRSFLSLIRTREDAEGLATTDDTKMLRGLFLVHLYAAFEMSVNAIVQEALREISIKKITYADMEIRFNAISLSNLFQAYADSKGKKIRKRLDILDGQHSSSQCNINDTIFSDKLQNVWATDLSDVCDCFCFSPTLISDPKTRTYVDEIVERRNAVAHGRESPVDAGSRLNANELEKRLIAIQFASETLADGFELHVGTLGFVKQAERAKYLP
jgi:hypothetical protein